MAVEKRHVIRQQNLRQLVIAAKQRGLSQKAYAVQVLKHKDDKYLSQLLAMPLGKKGSRPMGDETARQIEETLKLQPGYMSEAHDQTAAPPETIADLPERVFTNERSADKDLTALQIGIESLLATVVSSTQGSAAAFLQDLKIRSEKRKFGMKAGLLLQLQRIADIARVREEAVVPTVRRGGSVPNKKR